MKKLAINALNICDDISNIDSYLLVIKNKKILYKILSNSDLQYENSYIQILDENYKELKLSVSSLLIHRLILEENQYR